MAAVLRFLIAVLLFSSIASASLSQEEEEEFSEELLLKPLADRKVLAHFHFESKAPPTRTYGHHHRLFPKALYQLVISVSSFSFYCFLFLCSVWSLRKCWKIKEHRFFFLISGHFYYLAGICCYD